MQNAFVLEKGNVLKKIWVSRDVLVPFVGMWGQLTKHKVDV